MNQPPCGKLEIKKYIYGGHGGSMSLAPISNCPPLTIDNCNFPCGLKPVKQQAPLAWVFLHIGPPMNPRG